MTTPIGLPVAGETAGLVITSISLYDISQCRWRHLQTWPLRSHGNGFVCIKHALCCDSTIVCKLVRLILTLGYWTGSELPCRGDKIKVKLQSMRLHLFINVIRGATIQNLSQISLDVIVVCVWYSVCMCCRNDGFIFCGGKRIYHYEGNGARVRKLVSEKPSSPINWNVSLQAIRSRKKIDL